MSIIIQKAVLDDFTAVMYIYRLCVPLMNKAGLFNWNYAYPDSSTVMLDIHSGNLHVFREKEVIYGVMCLDNHQPEEYAGLKWKFDGPYLVVHRLAVHPSFRNRGIAEKMMVYAEEFALKHHFTSIRLDVISKNPQACRLYEKTGYQKVREIHLAYQKDKFICLEKGMNQK